jgi:hypothetical protein
LSDLVDQVLYSSRRTNRPLNSKDMRLALWGAVEFQALLLDLVIQIGAYAPRLQWTEALRPLIADAFLANENDRYGFEHLRERYLTGPVGPELDLEITSQFLLSSWRSASGLPDPYRAQLVDLGEMVLARGQGLAPIGLAVLLAADQTVLPVSWRDLVPSILRSGARRRLLAESGLIR